MKEQVRVVPYDPAWPKLFEQEAKLIKTALGTNCVEIHHFASTSVPGRDTKPKIDILAVVTSLLAITYSQLELVGFESRGEVIPTGRYFVKQSPKVHLHVFEVGNPMISRNLLFHDYLRAHESVRKEYADFKKKQASIHIDGMKYWEAKKSFIYRLIKQAQSEKIPSSNSEKCL